MLARIPTPHIYALLLTESESIRRTLQLALTDSRQRLHSISHTLYIETTTGVRRTAV